MSSAVSVDQYQSIKREVNLENISKNFSFVDNEPRKEVLNYQNPIRENNNYFEAFSENQLTDLNPIFKLGGKKIDDILRDIFFGEGKSDWDGYNAEPVGFPVFNNTIEFLDLLPRYLSPDDIVPEPSGDIGMIWEREDDILVVSIDKTNEIHYALNSNSMGKLFGNINYKHEIPEFVLKMIEQFILVKHETQKNI